MVMLRHAAEKALKILLKAFLQVRRISLGENKLNLLGKKCFLNGYNTLIDQSEN